MTESLPFDTSDYRPLADRLRPSRIEDVIGQEQILGPTKPLRRAIESGQLHSMIFWGPPGTGKTTLAKLIANHCDARFETLSAVLAGVKDIRAAVDSAKQESLMSGKRTVLFVDEVHRFNKAQQDAFLPHIEDGTITFIGATTENPSFELNNALLSRARVYLLKSLDQAQIQKVVERALDYTGLKMAEQLRSNLAAAADGDARRALNFLEIAADLSEEGEIGEDLLREVLSSGSLRRFDKGGEAFYDQISALHKSVRGSSPDAALYWFVRMIDGGCDPHYIARRVVRMAVEDIGLADPRALSMCLDAWQTYERIGSPEGELAIAQAIVYLSLCAKSNSLYSGYKAVFAEVKQSGSLEVPLHLRNAPTKLMKELDYGRDYRYAHNEDEGYAAGEKYLPEELEGKSFYQPSDRGFEIKIAEKMQRLRDMDAEANKGKS